MTYLVSSEDFSISSDGDRSVKVDVEIFEFLVVINTSIVDVHQSTLNTTKTRKPS